MEDFKSLFIATGVFAATMLTAAHLRYPTDSAISHLVSSAHASTSATVRAVEVRPVGGAVAIAATQGSAQVIPLFAALPLSAMPVRFEAPEARADAQKRVRPAVTRRAPRPRPAVQARAMPAAQVVAEKPVAEVTSAAKPSSDLLGDLLRGTIHGREG